MTLPDVLPCTFINPANLREVISTRLSRFYDPGFRKKSLSVIAVSGVCLLANAAWGNAFDLLKPKSFYAGLGTGLSYLNPKDDSSEYQVVDRKDMGAQLFLGVDTSKRSAFELQYTDLGTAELSDNALLDYQEASLSGLYFGLPQLGIVLGNGSSDIASKRGLYAYGRAGIGNLFTDASNLNHRQENDFHLLLGAGAELGLANNLALRAEYLSYDHDAKYLQLSLLYRFKTPARETPDNEGFTEVDALPVSTPVEQVAKAPDCSSKTSTAKPVGCPPFDGIMEGVNFVTNSAELTPGARTILNAAAIALQQNPDILVLINAHTDNRGSALFNLDLSARRALSTANYLQLKGVEPYRLIPQAYGETTPLAPNTTAAGRYRNRRVEFKILERN